MFQVQNRGMTLCISHTFCLQGYLGEMEDFLLIASLFEVTMIDPSVGTRPLTFELSIGELCIYVLDKKVGFRTHQQLTALIFINHHNLQNVYLSQFWTRGLI